MTGGRPWSPRLLTLSSLSSVFCSLVPCMDSCPHTAISRSLDWSQWPTLGSNFIFSFPTADWYPFHSSTFLNFASTYYLSILYYPVSNYPEICPVAFYIWSFHLQHDGSLNSGPQLLATASLDNCTWVILSTWWYREVCGHFSWITEFVAPRSRGISATVMQFKAFPEWEPEEKDWLKIIQSFCFISF